MTEPVPPVAVSETRRLSRLFPGISFRVRLLLALVGSVGLLGAAGMLVIRYESEQQVDWTVDRTVERARHALEELERFRRADLERVAERVTGSIRIAAALDAAVEDQNTSDFVEEVRYELTLAELKQGLVTFTDRSGRTVATLVDNVPLAATPVDDDLFAQVMAGEDTVVAGYRLVEGRLFAVQSHRLELFGDTVGTLTVGFAVDDDVAARLSAIVESELCFVARGRCVAGTPGARLDPLRAALLDAARAGRPAFKQFSGHRLALVSSQLTGGGGAATAVAVPLDEVLTPFDKMALVERTAAGVALALAILLGLVLSKTLTTPIRTLVGATDRVRLGDYDFAVAVPNRDEIGTLADAFNQMLEGLRLKERYRGVLDKVVSPDVAQQMMKGDLRLGGETRIVTTLFADVRGYTALSENKAPEEVIAMLNEWLELAVNAIEAEGGVVDKYVGDQVMAIFGAPIPLSDHAGRAVRAGLRLREETEALNDARRARGEQPFAVGIGINTGEAVAGNTGSERRLNYTVIGASVNLAARLCSDAEAGEILIFEDTYRAVSDLIDAAPRPPRTLKGFSRPVVPYAVLRWTAGR